MMRAYLKSLVHEKGAPAKQVVAGGRLSEEKCYSFTKDYKDDVLS